MPVDIEKIRDAFSKFEEEDFKSAKEIIQQEIRTAKEAYLQSKLGMEAPKEDVDEACKKKSKKKVIVAEESEEE